MFACETHPIPICSITKYGSILTLFQGETLSKLSEESRQTNATASRESPNQARKISNKQADLSKAPKPDMKKSLPVSDVAVGAVPTADDGPHTLESTKALPKEIPGFDSFMMY